jgi:hypothetical protein
LQGEQNPPRYGSAAASRVNDFAARQRDENRSRSEK